MIDYSALPSPCFVLDEERLKKNLATIARVKEESGVDIIVAFKGFAMWGAFPIVRKYVTGATASSLNEARLCNEEMKAKAHTYAVAYQENEFEAICQLSSHLTFNSLSQFERFHTKVPAGVSVGLRVNPEWSDVDTDLYNPSSPTSRLGMTIENLADGLPKEVEGLHFHVLCESSAESLVHVLENFERKFGQFMNQIKWVNMGGGHLMTRKGYDLDLLIKTLKKFREKYQVEVILEPGSAFAWQTGDLVSTVLDVVENRGVKTAIADISFTCHMPDCLEMPYKPVISGASKDASNSEFVYRIGGVSCLAGDFMDEYAFPAPLKVGDRLIFEDMIHYTMVKTTMFNGVNHPSIGIVDSSGNFRLIRKFDYEDYKARLS
jgi:carboxynorspermidine decarboxylase